jgi:hypothetical protein
MSNCVVQTDPKGRPYFDFKNIKVTLVSNVVDPEKAWAGDRYLQILTYRGAERNQTYPGPQIPITVRESETFDPITALRAFHGTLIGVTGDE